MQRRGNETGRISDFLLAGVFGKARFCGLGLMSQAGREGAEDIAQIPC